MPGGHGDLPHRRAPAGNRKAAGRFWRPDEQVAVSPGHG